MQLKKYQQTAIEKLKEYLENLKKFEGDPDIAFYNSTSEKYDKSAFGEVPFVCVKIPTGGGKTFVAGHSLVEIMTNYLNEKLDKGVLLWFAPTDAIFTQTLEKLKDGKDMHRKLLNEAFDNNIKVFSNEEALKLRKHEVEDNLCIIVASLEAFRKEVEKRPGYKVYRENGELLPFFENLKDDKNLEKDKSGVIYSLANVIRLYNPLIIVDEGHKTKTQTSIDFLKDLNPSFIIEYTATPRAGSNILVNIHSQELKKEEMVKIPLVLESKRDWQEIIDDGFLQRKELEKISKKEKEKIRPIALFQAEQVKEDKNKITVDQIEEYLIKEKKVPEEEIAIKTSGNNELEGVNLFAKNCKIRYIITVNALAEGWDCSFAYVLVSVANLSSKIAVEQIIGRIIRMPFAERRKNENLNKSYVFTSARNFQTAADQIIKGLEDNGFTKQDVINIKDKDKKSPFEVKKQDKFREKLAVPTFAFANEKLSFGEHLLGDDFKLSKQDHKFDFVPPMGEDYKGEIDITKEGEWWQKREKQLTLNFSKREKNASERDLILWLDKKLRFKELEKKEKVAYLKNVIDYQMKNKKKNLRELSLNRYPLKEKIEEKIKEAMEEFAKKNFDKFVKNKKIKLKVFDEFPDKLELTTDIVPQDYKKSYYDGVGKLNKEEKAFIDKLDIDELENIKFWARCREKQEDSFPLQGWENRNFYPDFIAVTNKGNILAFEWKGEHLKDNPDTLYKNELGKVWASLDKKLHFFLVHNGNFTNVLKEIKAL
ncbi:MAG: DEAD/DEAH box helicase family protein [Candidatus Thorarchaeota archaeon]|jgi:type III restriction enzyme